MDPGRTNVLIQQLISLRLLIGFLGEKKQRGWWDCAFLNSVGVRFLSEAFPRTARGAALRSTTEAARRSHDAAIGKLGTFHLFRLPTELEDRIEAQLDRLDLSDQQFSISSTEEGLDRLKSFIKHPLSAPQGPVQVGIEKNILSSNSVAELAAHYHSAFSNEFFCFPYFAAQNGR